MSGSTCHAADSRSRRMRRRASVIVTMMLSATALAAAQKLTDVHPGKGGSPHVKAEWTVDGAAISIEYGRPYVKGRADEKLMPPGQPWRTGADEATVLT